jgi:hypothetical protein
VARPAAAARGRYVARRRGRSPHASMCRAPLRARGCRTLWCARVVAIDALGHVWTIARRRWCPRGGWTCPPKPADAPGLAPVAKSTRLPPTPRTNA